MVQPLLELLRNHTGFHLVLIAGVALKGGSQSTEIQMYVGHLLDAAASDVRVHPGSRPAALWVRRLRSGANANRLYSQILSSDPSLGI